MLSKSNKARLCRKLFLWNVLVLLLSSAWKQDLKTRGVVSGFCISAPVFVRRRLATGTNRSLSLFGVQKTDNENPREESVKSQNKPRDSTVDTGIPIVISHEGRSCEIRVRPQETILAALERHAQLLQSQLPSLPEMPSDCRRGNCLTCAASFSYQQNITRMQMDTAEPKTTQAKVVAMDGLSPAISRLVMEKGYILTCCSYIPTPDTAFLSSSSVVEEQNATLLHLHLGENHALWQEVYASPGRFTTAEAQLAARSAMARVIRRSSERNVPAWTQKTEQILQRTPTE